MSTALKTRILANLPTDIGISGGDSLCGNSDWQNPYKFAQLLGAAFPTHPVQFIDQRPTTPVASPVAATNVQAGSGASLIRVFRDGIPGRKTLDLANNPSNIACGVPMHGYFIPIGINDACGKYSLADYTANLTYIGMWLSQSYGAEIYLVPPFWNETSLGVPAPDPDFGTPFGQAAVYAERTANVCAHRGFNYVKSREQVVRTYRPGEGANGLGDFFSWGEYVHPARAGHTCIAEAMLAAMMI